MQVIFFNRQRPNMTMQCNEIDTEQKRLYFKHERMRAFELPHGDIVAVNFDREIRDLADIQNVALIRECGNLRKEIAQLRQSHEIVEVMNAIS